MREQKSPASARLGRYVLIHKIATGGVADIYLAKTKATNNKDRYLVLKCLRRDAKDNEDFLETIINEAQLAVRMRHPNIVEVFDLCEVDGQQFLAMEYLDACDFSSVLKHHIQKDDYLPFGLALHVVKETALGLQYAHELKNHDGSELSLVHRDISSQNILLSASGDIKISDFGIAKTAMHANHTPSGIIKGKFHYMSPEQAWGDKVDRRSDIFSLGIVLYEALVGREAYPYEDISLLIDKARIAQFSPPRKNRPEIPEELEAILLKSLELDKNDRYQSAKEFADVLESYRKRHYPKSDNIAWIKHLNQIHKVKQKLPLLNASQYVRDIHSLLPEHLAKNNLLVSDDNEITEQYAVDEVQRVVSEKIIAITKPKSKDLAPKQSSFAAYYAIIILLIVALIVTILYFFVL